MSCEDFLNRLNARADGELSAEDAIGLEAHLAECSQCRSVAEAFQTVDADLRLAFASRRDAAARLADRVAAMVRESNTGTTPVSLPVASAPRIAWQHALVGVAAGFLLAVALFRPWESTADIADLSPPIEPVARLAVATGPVEVRFASQLEAFTCPTGGAIEPDSVVSTGPTARCEISMQDGNALRLDTNTEVKLQSSKTVEVSRGRLWSSSQGASDGYEIQSGGGTIVAKPASEVAVDCQPDAVRLFVLEGEVNVQTGKESMRVGPGKHVQIVKGKLEDDPEWRDALLETAWVNSVAALGGSEHPEFVERVNRLLANVGSAKLSLLYEDELRRLGDDGVPPLLAYLESTRGDPTLAQRATASRIVADVAQSRWIADLISLLTDANADVRFHAARGLERLTGRNQGCTPQAWHEGPWTRCESPHKKWLDWWVENRDSYPASRREIPAPTSPPF
jgi:hypothetical protein